MAAPTRVPRATSSNRSRRCRSDSESGLGFADDSFSSDGERGEADSDGKNKDDSEAGDTAASRKDQNAGWADAMARILGKETPESKPIILLKNKKLERERGKEKQRRLDEKRQLDKKRQWELMSRVKPDVVRDKESERNLQRIATRGVVQLFNAVRKHQSNMDEKVKEAGTSERRRAKLMSSVTKRDFISVLRGQEGKKTEKNAIEKLSKSKKQGVAESGDKPEWRILRDDFMMGATMKDWDKESDDEEGQ
ncbi:RRP15-like protein [Microcaecilia unicolor]|uniref:RRP15-like protein n=1 Tax=Microcaecilia unicolor TaxID=1415580 RepID=A0A6P7XIL1_9AMPH|nr:RRP15-like protein [Microcaecilia unicolor]